jgi:hypothetical protein
MEIFKWPEVVDNLAGSQPGLIQHRGRGLAEHMAGDPGELLSAPCVAQIPARVRQIPPATAGVRRQHRCSTAGDVDTDIWILMDLYGS